jgi:hypothetical protein
MASLTRHSAPVTLTKTGIAWPSDISKKFLRSSLLFLCHHCFPAIFLQFLDLFAHVHPSEPKSSNPNRITLTFPSQPQHYPSIGFQFEFREHLLRSIWLETSSSSSSGSSSSSTCINTLNCSIKSSHLSHARISHVTLTPQATLVLPRTRPIPIQPSRPQPATSAAGATRPSTPPIPPDPSIPSTCCNRLQRSPHALWGERPATAPQQPKPQARSRSTTAGTGAC